MEAGTGEAIKISRGIYWVGAIDSKEENSRG
jgi:hypothetical protein